MPKRPLVSPDCGTCGSVLFPFPLFPSSPFFLSFPSPFFPPFLPPPSDPFTTLACFMATMWYFDMSILLKESTPLVHLNVCVSELEMSLPRNPHLHFAAESCPLSVLFALSQKPGFTFLPGRKPTRLHFPTISPRFQLNEYNCQIKTVYVFKVCNFIFCVHFK